MKIKELFNQCNADEIYLFLKANKPLPKLTKKEFLKRYNNLVNVKNTDNEEGYYLIYTPYILQNSNQTERDVFLIKKEEAENCIRKDVKPFDALLMISRISCGDISNIILLNSELCSLSQKAFNPLEICAEIFFDVAISIEDIFTEEKHEVSNNLRKLRLEMNGQISERQYIATPDIDTVINQNVFFMYPYFVSVAED